MTNNYLHARRDRMNMAGISTQNLGDSLYVGNIKRIENLLVWLSAGDIAQADNSSVIRWNDRSNNHLDLYSLENVPPILKTNIVNGKNVVRFDGGDSISWPIGIDSTPFHCFAVILPVASGHIGTIVSGTSSSLQFRLEANYKQSLIKSEVVNICESTTALSTVNFNYISASYDTPNAAFRLNGVDDGSASSAQTVGNILWMGRMKSTGGTEWIHADIAEIIIFNRVLSTGERNSVEDYMKNTYGL
jgi:hypothetical protein